MALRLAHNELIVHDAETLEIRHSVKGRETRVDAAAFGAVSFAANGRAVAVAGLDDQLTVWNAADWSELRRFPETRGVTGAVMFPEGKEVAAVGPDNFARLWNVDSGAEVGRLSGHSAPVISVALSPDARTLATGSVDRTVRLWNAATHDLIATLEGHVAPVLSLAFAPDGKTLASTAAGFDVLLWRLDDATPTAAHLIDPEAEARARRGGEGAVIALSVLSLLGGRPAPPGAFRPDYLKPAFNCPLAYSADGRLLAIIHHLEDSVLKSAYSAEVYDVATGKQVSRYSGTNSALAFSPDGRTLATGGVFRFILLDPLTGVERRK